MSAEKAISKRVLESNNLKRNRVIVDDDFDAAISNDIKGILSALQHIKEKAQKDGHKKNEETISKRDSAFLFRSKYLCMFLHRLCDMIRNQVDNEETFTSVSSEIKSSLDELKSQLEKERQNFAKTLNKSSKECENLLKNETTKFQEIFEKFCKEKAMHLQALKEVISKYEEEKERLLIRYEQLRKKEKNMLTELEKSSAARIGQLEESLKKKKQDDKTFSILRKTLGSFLGNASDEDFPPDD